MTKCPTNLSAQFRLWDETTDDCRDNLKLIDFNRDNKNKDGSKLDGIGVYLKDEYLQDSGVQFNVRYLRDGAWTYNGAVGISPWRLR